MKKTLTVLLLIASLVSFSQPYKIENSSGASFSTMQKQFLDWSSNKNLNNTKGWKYYKRWEYDMQSRVALNGKIPDFNILFNTATKIASVKKTKDKTGNNWTPVGPMDNPQESGRGIGRINCITFHPSDTNTFWVGVAQGGVWKTTNGGSSWIPLTDNLPVIRVSDIALDPNNSDVMYISMGDYAYIGVGLELDDRKRNTHYGIGVYKSTDGGNTWNTTGLSYNQPEFDNTLIRRVFVNPNNSDNVVAAGVEGIFNSFDGGASFTKVNSNIIWDFEQDPNNAQTLFATKGQIKNLGIGLGTSGILKSTDFGATWIALNTGIPTNGDVQRIEITISTKNTNYIYAVCSSASNNGLYGIYRSTDGGSNWTNRAIYTSVNNILGWYQNSVGGQGAYDLTILVDPDNEEKVYVGGVNIWGSTDGGVTWNGITHWWNQYGESVHGDQHQLKHNPINDKFYACNDGGLYTTYDLEIVPWGTTWPTKWTQLNDNRMTTSFYKLGVSAADENTLIAGAQDNSTFFKSGSNWINIIGGDGMDCIAHPTNPQILYGSWQYGNLCRSYDGGNTIDYSIFNENDEGGWVTPYMLSPADPDVVYGAYGNLWQSNDQGTNWTKISNFPIIPGYGYATPSSAMDVSVSNSDVIYVAKRLFHSYNYPSELWITKDEGGSWTDITYGLPDSLYFTDVEISNSNPDIAWVTCGGFVDGVKIFKTTDAGQTWTNATFNLPNIPINNIEHEKNSNKNTLYIATDVGVYYMSDIENKWHLYSDGLPNVIVSDIELHENSKSIYIATFGRGIWKIDFATPKAIDVGIENGDENYTSIKVTPNPNKGNFLIDFSLNKQYANNIELSIINVMGSVVFEKEIKFMKENKRNLALNLKSGLYYIQVKNGNYRSTKKFVVE